MLHETELRKLRDKVANFERHYVRRTELALPHGRKCIICGKDTKDWIEEEFDNNESLYCSTVCQREFFSAIEEQET